MSCNIGGFADAAVDLLDWLFELEGDRLSEPDLAPVLVSFFLLLSSSPFDELPPMLSNKFATSSSPPVSLAAALEITPCLAWCISVAMWLGFCRRDCRARSAWRDMTEGTSGMRRAVVDEAVEDDTKESTLFRCRTSLASRNSPPVSNGGSSSGSLFSTLFAVAYMTRGFRVDSGSGVG
jgi:hypothetical protein